MTARRAGAKTVRSRARQAAAVLGLGLLGCGGGDGVLGLSVDASALGSAEPVSAYQVQFVQLGAIGSCGQLYAQAQCLKDVVGRSQMVLLRDGAASKEVPAVQVPASIQLGGSTQQTQPLQVPVGRGYALVLEALSQAVPVHLVATSCTAPVNIEAGNNTLGAFQDPFVVYDRSAGGPSCDPTWPAP